MLARDPGVPQRDALLDDRLLAATVDGLLGLDGPIGVTRVERLRVKYRVGRGLGLVLRVHTARRAFTVSARSFEPGRGRSNFERSLTVLPPVVAGLRPVGFAAGLETVFWTFPHDRRISSLELLCGPNQHLTRLVGQRCIPMLAAYVPEKAGTARCLDERGATVAYVKVYSGSEDATRSHDTLAALHRALAGPESMVRVPHPIGCDPAHQALAVEAIAGEPLRPDRPAGAGLARLGAALASLHDIPAPPALGPFKRLTSDRLTHAAALIGKVRPDVARATDALARTLAATFEDDSALVCLHGDAHAKNAIADADGVGLIDFDQAGLGPPAADLASVLASLRYQRCIGHLSEGGERCLAEQLLDGYRSVRTLPDPRTLAWHTAASLLIERGLRAVTRVRRPGLAHLAEVIDAGHRTARPSRSGRFRRARPPGKPPLLLYCQHAIGLGHLRRSLTLAGALSERFAVVLLSGGTVPRHLRPPSGVEIVALPPLILKQGGGLQSADGRRSVKRAKTLRAGMLSDAVRAKRPAVVMVELFPFGRRAFTDEIVPMLEEARSLSNDPPLVVSSVRDILVGRGDEQQTYDERACRLANTYFDAILVHADPRFATLEESFRPSTPLRVPVNYTGFVVTRAPADAARARETRCVVVSAGGGRVGETLLQAALDAHPDVCEGLGMRMRLIAGPFLDDAAWGRLRARARGRRGVELCRDVGDLTDELRTAAVSISQCGYNTSLEVLQARIPALVVPYLAPGEDEQLRRAKRLAALGAMRMIDPRELTGARLAHEVTKLVGSTPAPSRLDLDGARASADLLWARWRERAPERPKAAIA